MSFRYHIPSHVQEHVDYITPGIKLISTSKKDLAKRSTQLGRGGGHGRHGKGPIWAPKPMPNFPNPLSNLSTCDVLITPACVKALYEIPPATKANPNNAMGIFEEGDYYDQEDLNLFFEKYTPYIPQGTHPTPNFVDGAEAPVPVSEGGGESTLDFELAYPLLYPQKLVLYQTDDINYATENPTEGAFNTFLDAIDGVSVL